METYRVEWEIEIDAETPELAARKALEIHRNPESIATFFTVWSEDGNESTRVDLLELDEESWGTLEGAERYLEHADRMAFLDLRRAKQANYNPITVDFLTERWMSIGEAWGIVNSLLKQAAAV